jgi:hypothetical protein
MKIYINVATDAEVYGGRLREAIENIGFEIVSELDADFDSGLAVTVPDHAEIAAALALKNKPVPPTHYLCDKWYMYNFLKKNNIPAIETCFPKTIQDVQDFFDQHGEFVVKPRVGGGGVGPWGLHYNRYSSVEDFEADASQIDNLWLLQSSDIYSATIQIKQFILQPYLVGSNDGYTEQIRIKGDVNHIGDFVFHTTQRVRKTVQNSNTLTYDPKKWNESYMYIRAPGKQEAYDREPNDMTYQDPEIEPIVSEIINACGLRSTYCAFECLIVDDVFYVNDITTIPPDVRYTFAATDGINYISDGLRWQYGLKEEPPLTFARYYQMAAFPIPGGVTREKIADIENNNVKKLYKTFVGASEVWLIIRGQTREEFDLEKQRLIDYLESLE